MHWPQKLLIIFILLIKCNAQPQNHRTSSLEWTNIPVLNDKIFIGESVIFDATVRSKFECAGMCNVYVSPIMCLSFTFTPKGRCQGHNITVTLGLDHEDSVGAKTFQPSVEGKNFTINKIFFF